MKSIRKKFGILKYIFSNQHVNTILPLYLSYNINPVYAKERIYTPDNDFMDLDWINQNKKDVPIVVLLHGAEGNSSSHYAKRIMQYIEHIGWRGVVAHFRSCSSQLNRTPRFYHAGETEDILWALQHIKRYAKDDKLFVIGVSLGGNALLKLLGERDNHIVDKAFVMSVPFDLNICVNALDRGINKYIYANTFLETLLPKMKQYASRFNDFTYHKINTLNEFNQVYICKTFDFRTASEYYTMASCINYIKNIKTPTLILQARNDPMVPIAAWPKQYQLSPFTKFIATNTGGHAGFFRFGRGYKDGLFRLPRFIMNYFAR